MSGFIQLIDKNTKEILEQRLGDTNHIEYYSNHVWKIDFNPTLDVVFSEHSDVAQPYKFFKPIKKDTIIFIYKEYLGETKPTNIEPTWTGKAFELEKMVMSAHQVAGVVWNAFTSDGEFIGTSEY